MVFGALQPDVVTVFVMHVPVDDPAFLRPKQDDIRFDRAGREDDHARPDPAIVSHTPAQDRPVGIRKLVIPVPGADGRLNR